MDELAKQFPEDVKYDVRSTPPSSSRDPSEVFITLFEAGILVLIVIMVFLRDWRAMLVPATTMPVTIIGAFAAMAALGFTVNLSTMFGIVLAIGIVVDDAIVIVEAWRAISSGHVAHDAAIRRWTSCSARSSASPWC